ncbi:MAG: EI24 domain-containing protein [Candidatus Cloacimonetes bacterium]|nr:EI24 domain-containing protein [Candidatus Cloacimonadota bacterium]
MKLISTTNEIAAIPLTYLRVIGSILTSMKLLLLTLLPAGLAVVVFIASFVALLTMRLQLVQLVYDRPDWIQTLLQLLSIGLACLVSALISVITTLTLAGFLIEKIVAHFLQQHGLHAPTGSFWQSFIRSLRDDLRRLMAITMVSLIILFATIIPPLAIVALLLGAFLVGYDLLDLPATILEIPFSRRWQIARNHLLLTTALGFSYSLILMVPIVNILLAPTAYSVGAIYLARWHHNGLPKIPNF